MTIDPTPYFIMGALSGTTATLLIQAYGRHKVARATAAMTVSAADQDQQLVTQELRDRVRVLEQIITDQPRQLADSIERLR